MTFIYYTHNAKPCDFMLGIYDRNVDMANRLGARFIAVVAEPFSDTDVVVPFDPEPKYLDIYRRILTGLRLVKDEMEPVYMLEDDVLYPDEHFDMEMRGDLLVYQMNFAFMDRQGFFRIPRGNIALSQVFGTKRALMWNYTKKFDECQGRRMACCEPAGPEYRTATASHENMPCIDIRNGLNATWTGESARARPDTTVHETLPGWAPWPILWDRYCGCLSPTCAMCGGTRRVDIPFDGTVETVHAWTECPMCKGV